MPDFDPSSAFRGESNRRRFLVASGIAASLFMVATRRMGEDDTRSLYLEEVKKTVIPRFVGYMGALSGRNLENFEPDSKLSALSQELAELPLSVSLDDMRRISNPCFAAYGLGIDVSNFFGRRHHSFAPLEHSIHWEDMPQILSAVQQPSMSGIAVAPSLDSIGNRIAVIQVV